MITDCHSEHPGFDIQPGIYVGISMYRPKLSPFHSLLFVCGEHRETLAVARTAKRTSSINFRTSLAPVSFRKNCYNLDTEFDRTRTSIWQFSYLFLPLGVHESVFPHFIEFIGAKIRTRFNHLNARRIYGF
jgi:hypothetical protein